MTDHTRTPQAKARTITRRQNQRLAALRYSVTLDADRFNDAEPHPASQLDAWHQLHAWQLAEVS